MAKVLTEAFSHSEMFEAIEYFLQVTPYLTDENGNDRKVYIGEINEKPETKKYRYRILTTLRHAQRLYDKEKPDNDLFTSLITPDIVEVSLCLYKLDDYMKEVDKPVYEMVYKVFEKIRTSYLEPYWDALNNKKEIASKRLQETRRILKALQAWDRQWGDDGDRLLTEKDLLLLDYLEPNYIEEVFFKLIERLEEALNKLIERFEAYKRETKPLKKPEAFAELYFFRGNANFNLDKHQVAIDDYTEAIKLNLQYADAYYARGDLKYNQKDDTGAIKDYSTAIELKPNYAEAYNHRGCVKYYQKDYTGAIKDYSTAIELKPDFALAYNSRGVTYRAMAQQARDNGNVTEAEKLQAEEDKDFAEFKRLTEKKIENNAHAKRPATT